MVNLVVNGKPVEANADDDASLLWFLRDELGLTGTKFGCGVASCGACTVHVDGQSTYACQTFIADLEGAEVVTIEGLDPNGQHPLQKAWVAEQVPQCGYCQSGQIMRAATLLSETPNPTAEEIREHMSTNLCRCGTYPRITRAIERAAKEA